MKGLDTTAELSSYAPKPSAYRKLQRPFSILFICLALSNLYASLTARYYEVYPPVIAVAGNRLPSDGGIGWQPCPDVSTTLCAYLDVPLDYGFGEKDVEGVRAGRKVNLALRMLPGTAKASERLGNLFINPGGPGGSGTSMVLRAGPALSTILQGRYNILSWDPRSVNLTSPALGCFPTPGDGTRFAHDAENLGLPFGDGEFNASRGHASADRQWMKGVDSYNTAMVDACTESGDQGILRGSSTALVVRDIKSIMDALGEVKLSYWGFSYGTILGATFSAMFPDLIHRVLLDGVSDSSLYTSNMLDWGRSGMDDTDKTYEGFLSSCAASGPLGCALAHTSPVSTNVSIRQGIEDIIAQLRIEPMSVGRSKVGPGIVVAHNVVYSIFHSLYSPKSWPALATALAQLQAGNGTLIYEMNNPNNAYARTDGTDNVFGRSMESSIASTATIMCSDSDLSAISATTLDEMLEYIHELGSKSVTGQIWALWVSTCRKWTFKATEVYRGPWTVADGLKKTSFPVLFFSNTADPVTPLSAAITMSKGFGSDSASLLIQNGFGHCSLAHPSLCTAKKARAYFLDGVVPAYGTTCDADEGYLFPHPKNATTQVSTLSEEDAALSRALETLAEQVGGFRMR